MIFEEALALMRKGKKIRHPSMPEDEYYMACRVSLHPDISEPINVWEMPMSIVWMKSERKHDDMGIGSLDKLPKDWDKPCKHGHLPQINLLLLMRDDWELVE